MQLRHFAQVIKGNENPLVSGEEGLESLRVIEGMLQSASENRPIGMDEI